MDIGKELRKIRRSAEMTQAEAAALLEMTVAQLSQYETGKRTPKIGTIGKMIECAHNNHAGPEPFNDPSPEMIALIKKHDAYEAGLSDLLRRLNLPWNYDEAGGLVILEPLNDIGQAKVLDYAADIAKIPEYRSDTQPE